MLFRDFLDYARWFHQAARESDPEHTSARYTSAAVLFAWIAVEALINDMLADFAALKGGPFSIHERGFLEERSVEFVRSGDDFGRFVISNRPDYKPLDDKIMFLLARFGGGTKLDKGSPLWQKFEKAKTRRDLIAHPRKDRDTPFELGVADGEDAIEVAEAIIQVVARRVWEKKLDV